MAPRFVPLKTRFDQKWRLDPASGCWIWEAAVHVNGYGKIYVNGALKVAHRVGWQLYRGLIPEGTVLDHLCRRNALPARACLRWRLYPSENRMDAKNLQHLSPQKRNAPTRAFRVA